MSKDYIDNKAHLGENKEKLLLNYKDISLYSVNRKMHLQKLINEPTIQKFFFLRHGSTDWNIGMLILGPQDLSLNDKGENQVTLSVTKLQYIKIDSIVSSSLKRSLETKDIVIKSINIHPNKIFIDNALEERNYGDWSRHKESIQNILDRSIDNKVKYKDVQDIIESRLPTDAETKDDFEIRVAESMVKHLHDALVPEIPLIISHGCVKSVIMKFMGLNDVNINYGEIVSFRFSEHKWSVNSIDEYELTGNTNDFN